ncbi:hydantoinase/oxoprolinase family protein [Chelatococcus asaccharovorans]|uniref:hydantoinase/oxoprolinase family protein n=1 Tax=Chelatococcus asaccharovorans TaxID=28210 RepID=UPI00224C6AEE|nr:hydantoinase/oxoprolinase family protein [Chelatococcus asaccharovorans]CAH1655583.1 N-methylhydantoinase A [Chelatococcus asaccharovorans]CAH1685377.1 N-methylhydantoinase A [Chelatococcus asaccharovorans]
MAELKLSVDVGGTFTDVVLRQGDKSWTTKVLTTPRVPEEGVLAGISEILASARRRFDDVDIFVHGTTLATNAIIERRGARTALLTTQGFRDVLEMGTESRFDQYDLELVRPAPVVPRPFRFGVPERMDARGLVRVPLDEQAVLEIAAQLERESVEAVAVSFLHAYINPAHEKAVGTLLASRLPHVAVSLSHEVCPEIREYERTSTTVLNAYVQPLMDRYLDQMEQRLIEAGFRGAIALMTSGGGLTSLSLARRFPIRMVESGPAGGAIFACQLAKKFDETKVLAFDMGGTTAKLTLLDDFSPTKNRFFEVDRTARFLKGSGLPIRIPVVEMVEIGAGGGSIARLDLMNRINVGPESASSDPGPACYGLGGEKPTVSDADLVLGFLDPDRFSGNKIALKPELARDAVHRAVGEGLGLSPHAAAHGIYEMVCENMASAARAHAVEQGAAAEHYTMIAFGGAAPVHAARLAEKLRIGRVIIPRSAGVGSAIGFLDAPVSFESVRSFTMRLDQFDPERLDTFVSAMSNEVRAWVSSAAGDAPLVEHRQAYMRYLGQGHEIPVTIPQGPYKASDAEAFRAVFEEAYQAQFDRVIPYAEIEILSVCVLVSTATQELALVPPVGRIDGAKARGTVEIYDGQANRMRTVPIYDRETLTSGMRIAGPAIVAEAETTTVVTANFDAHIDAIGSIVLEAREQKI